MAYITCFAYAEFIVRTFLIDVELDKVTNKLSYTIINKTVTKQHVAEIE